MCGIGGEIALQQGQTINAEALKQASEAMHSRGPDGHGYWEEDNKSVGLVHRRLTIIDLSDSAAQPMIDNKSRYVISFNGEIYNYKSLREHCQSLGYEFKTQSDTEVLLALFEYYSTEMLERLRGMFAFAIYDRNHKQLFLARDPLGIKPLYYTLDASSLRFCSSLNAMVKASWVDSDDIDKNAIASFYNLGTVQEPSSCYSQAKALPAGSFAIVSLNEKTPSLDIKPYWSLHSVMADVTQKKSRSNSRTLIAEAVAESVNDHLVSDQAVGLFLSAGIDSTVVAMMMRRCLDEKMGEEGVQPLSAITLGFSEFQDSADDEVAIAAQVAQEYGFEHHIYHLSKEEFLAELPAFFEAMEQPTIDALNVWFVAKAAKKAGLKVVLSGIGGDEAFGGYPSFSRIPMLLRWAPVIKSIPQSLLGRLFAAVNQQKLKYLKNHINSLQSLYKLQRAIYMPEELGAKLDDFHRITGKGKAGEGFELKEPSILTAQTIQTTQTASLNKSAETISFLEVTNYLRNQLLRDADWAGMAHSVEIRTPLVDHKLYEQLAMCDSSVRFEKNKASLLNLLDEPARNRIESRAKTGFVLPMQEWMAGDDKIDHWSRFYIDMVADKFFNREKL